jgi:hypothetical protein
MNRRLVGLLLGSLVVGIWIAVQVANGRLLAALFVLIGWVVVLLVIGSVGGWRDPG